MSDSTDAVLALAASAAEWTHTQAFRIPSRSRPWVRYVTTADSCSCKAFAASRFTGCIHIAAVKLVAQLAADPCQELELTRLPNGEYAWLRPIQ